jgi:glycosyltransferase involved in cell wall biosynthesis
MIEPKEILQQEERPENTPLVSIIIITYNHASLLGEAVASAVRQTKAVHEIIVVDDGSTDNPSQVIKSFPDVRFIRQANRGPSAARNTGWRASTGQYIVFLDADDRLPVDAVSNHLRVFQENSDCGFVHGFYQSVDREWQPLPTPAQMVLGSNAFERLLQGNPLALPAVMFRKDLLADVGGFDERLRGSEDYDLYLRLARRHPAQGSSLLAAEIRRHDANSSSNIPMMFRTAMSVLNSQREYALSRDEWRHAYLRGQRNLTELYCRNQLREIRAAIRGRVKWKRTLQSSWKMFIVAPPACAVTMIRVAAREAYQMLSPQGGSNA